MSQQQSGRSPQQQQQQQQHASYIYIKNLQDGKRYKFVSKNDIKSLTGSRVDLFLQSGAGIKPPYKVTYHGRILQRDDVLRDLGVEVGSTLDLQVGVSPEDNEKGIGKRSSVNKQEPTTKNQPEKTTITTTTPSRNILSSGSNSQPQQQQQQQEQPGDDNSFFAPVTTSGMTPEQIFANIQRRRLLRGEAAIPESTVAARSESPDNNKDESLPAKSDQGQQKEEVVEKKVTEQEVISSNTNQKEVHNNNNNNNNRNDDDDKENKNNNNNNQQEVQNKSESNNNSAAFPVVTTTATITPSAAASEPPKSPRTPREKPSTPAAPPTWVLIANSENNKKYKFVSRGNIQDLKGCRIKQFLNVAAGIDEADQRLSFENKEIGDDVTLKDAGVAVGSTLQVQRISTMSKKRQDSAKKAAAAAAAASVSSATKSLAETFGGPKDVDPEFDLKTTPTPSSRTPNLQEQPTIPSNAKNSSPNHEVQENNAIKSPSNKNATGENTSTPHVSPRSIIERSNKNKSSQKQQQQQHTEQNGVTPSHAANHAPAIFAASTNAKTSIYIKNVADDKHYKFVSSTNVGELTGGKIKHFLWVAAELPVEEQTIRFNNMIVDDYDNLAEHGIESKDVLTLEMNQFVDRRFLYDGKDRKVTVEDVLDTMLENLLDQKEIMYDKAVAEMHSIKIHEFLIPVSDVEDPLFKYKKSVGATAALNKILNGPFGDGDDDNGSSEEDDDAKVADDDDADVVVGFHADEHAHRKASPNQSAFAMAAATASTNHEHLNFAASALPTESVMMVIENGPFFASRPTTHEGREKNNQSNNSSQIQNKTPIKIKPSSPDDSDRQDRELNLSPAEKRQAIRALQKTNKKQIDQFVKAEEARRREITAQHYTLSLMRLYSEIEDDIRGTLVDEEDFIFQRNVLQEDAIVMSRLHTQHRINRRVRAKEALNVQLNKSKEEFDARYQRELENARDSDFAVQFRRACNKAHDHLRDETHLLHQQDRIKGMKQFDLEVGKDETERLERLERLVAASGRINLPASGSKVNSKDCKSNKKALDFTLDSEDEEEEAGTRLKYKKLKTVAEQLAEIDEFLDN